MSAQVLIVLVGILVRVLLLRTDTMTKVTFNWGWLTGSEVQAIIIRWEHGSIQAGMVQEELRVLHLHLKADGGRLDFQAARMRV